MKVITRKEAIEQGLKYYFTGKPCKNGHNEKSYVVNCSCVQCRRDTVARYRNSEQGQKKREEYYERTKHHHQSIRAKYVKNNPEKVKKAISDWVKRNRAKTREYYIKCDKRARENLSDRYLYKVLAKDGFKRKDIPDWMIELKRAQLKLLRKVQNET